MSHELKTPMTAIRVYLEWIKDGVIQINTKNIDSLTGELGRLTRIVESLMHFQTFESRPTDFRHTKINFIDVFNIVQETHSGELSNHKQTMVYAWPKKATMVFDQDSLVQIFHNIVGNFLRYAGPDTQLRVNFFHESSTDILIFQDNGRGLSIIDKIVRDAGGAVDIISVQGTGFTARIEIPHQKPRER